MNVKLLKVNAVNADCHSEFAKLTFGAFSTPGQIPYENTKDAQMLSYLGLLMADQTC